MSKHDTPLAFPHVASDGHPDYRPGMTLRDWFAGQALAGISANSSYDDVTPPGMAKDAYNFADAMLAERDKDAPR